MGLWLKCPKCQMQIPLSARVCPNCGQNLANLSKDQRVYVIGPAAAPPPATPTGPEAQPEAAPAGPETEKVTEAALPATTTPPGPMPVSTAPKKNKRTRKKKS